MSEQNEQLNSLASEGGLVPPSDAERNDAPVSDVQAITQLQAILDAAVDAEPEAVTPAAVFDEPTLAASIARLLDMTNGLEIGLNAHGKTLKPPRVTTKFKALNGRQIVYALPVKGFRADQKTAEHFIILSDDSERPRPLLHGYIPKVGDMFVQYTPITLIDTNQAYVEQGETIIMGKRLFEALYYPVQE
jgi:hypothetical protein